MSLKITKFSSNKFFSSFLLVFLLVFFAVASFEASAAKKDNAKATEKAIEKAIEKAGAKDFSRKYITMAGSSTVYPFSRMIAEEFGRNTRFRTPIVEATGTGGGMKLFCGGVGRNFVDFANASRRITAGEIANCRKNGIKDIVEIEIGFDGIVLANSNQAPIFDLTKEQIFLALAQDVPQNGRLIKNPHQKWSDIDPKLSDKEIAIYGPPPTSGTRDAFVELIMEKFCAKHPVFVKKYPDKKKRKKICHIIRSDGKFIEAGENDNLIIQKLRNNKDALGIFGFSFLEQNAAIVHGAKIGGIYPTFANIVVGDYSVSRPLFIYFKKEHLHMAPGMKEFVKEMVSHEAIGSEGYLISKGLIPKDPDMIDAMWEKILGGL